MRDTAGRRSSNLRRTRLVERHLDDVPAAGSPWNATVLVDPDVAHYGRYGDERWAFGAQAPNQRATCCDVRWRLAADGGMWPDQVWATIGRDLGMALYGRRADRPYGRRGGYKPVTVCGRLARFSAIARWLVAEGLGTPDCWDETIGPRLLEELRAGRVVGRHGL